MKVWCAAVCLAFAPWRAALGADAPALAEEPPAVQDRPLQRPWDAALGLVVGYAPEYPGASRWRLHTRPGGWLRWGRVSIASSSSFVVRGGEPASGGGLRVDLSPSERIRVGLGLRHDSGRRESDSADLRGLGDVRATVRLRLSTSMPLAEGWRLGATLNADALGHGGGTIAELRINRGVPLGPRTSAGFGASLSFGNRRHLRAYYGITPEQAARSGYPVHEPGAGPYDLAVTAGLRHQLDPQWFTFGGISASRLLGSAASSPIVREPTSWGISAGLAYRF